MKQQFQANNQAIKILALGLLLLFITTFIYAQNKNETKGFHVQKLIITKDKDHKKWGDSSNHRSYLAFNYDYGDSISVFVKTKNICNVRLKYVLDTNTTFYPYNRAFLRLSKTYFPKYSKCHIIFWGSKQRVTFRLNRKFAFYILGVSKNESTWHLNYSNTYPWPD